MSKFFDILSADNNMEETFNLFSNKYLDELFKPEWERFGIKLPRAAMNGFQENGKTKDVPTGKENAGSSCCVLS